MMSRGWTVWRRASGARFKDVERKGGEGVMVMFWGLSVV